MFAVLKTGGKQYRVATGDVLRVEKLAAEAGDKVQFNEVLMIGGETVTVGAPTIEGAAVQAEVIDQIKGPKLIHFVKRRRKHSSKRTKGHRQQLTLLRVGDILTEGAGSTGVKAAVGAGSVSGAAMAAVTEATEAALGVSDTASDEAKIAEAATAGTRPTNLLEAARGGKADDLKKISGVGPKLEGLLHENGVFHFDQIAAWGDEEIAYMDDKLSFKGRIARDGWIDQAKQFAAEQE
ncbi:50S ribosomal protein L21 [Jannaschia seohaensis]|uniref:Large ribosomal subunit protein bL21 n=1 Tax=Jannaschia seohaensis TaxID=475081 RepID=A0A2Y9ANI9_9RHOB|nr:50S ribosomal protein L21 [Jannaschia seohaensis]PWJ19369.1 large subunit ribosomal protein L21 [Jannaschia seohaensis]SSA46031.1 large subunit ribosomal protein L21 [Jannaschia seohaensis]